MRFSSFKKDQILMENWRKFLKEDRELEKAEKIESEVGVKPPDEQQKLAGDAVEKLTPDAAAKLLAQLETVREEESNYAGAILNGIIVGGGSAAVAVGTVGAIPAIAGILGAVATSMGIEYVKNLLKKKAEISK